MHASHAIDVSIHVAVDNNIDSPSGVRPGNDSDVSIEMADVSVEIDGAIGGGERRATSIVVVFERRDRYRSTVDHRSDGHSFILFEVSV